MTQNQKIKSLKSKPNSVILKQYNDSKHSLPTPCVAQKFHNIDGYSIELFLATKKWFDTVVIPNQKRGLNIQGYMRLIAM